MSKLEILNMRVDNLTLEESIDEIKKLVKKKNPSYLVTPNVDHVVLLEKDNYFKEIYQYADLVLTDGKPLIWISRLRKKPIVEKVSGSDLFPEVCKMASKEGFSIFILGAAEGVAEKAKKKLCSKYPGLLIVGTNSPPHNFENDPLEVKNVIQNIKDKKPDILAVSLGSPKGEKFIYTHLAEINVPLCMSIGATIDFEAGNIRRAPKWISNIGFEWLYRVFKEPKRLAKRYINDFFAIIPIIIKYRN
ncbi:WecB/TagA/CpsF family glycosyltransferase [Enterococcus sp. DIV0187]|uniref:WecB/TagA/CpsF family glycosyltransferase n=1 Tax=Enterococcus sp. DIV0187 TaxID=2774644 RepID=UPI003F220484